MTPAAGAKINRALVLIERAQNALSEACAELSPVVGVCPEWERVGKLADRVKAQWHRLNRLDGPFRLDSEAKP